MFRSASKEYEDCAVCWQPLTSVEADAPYGCKHAFHARCVARWRGGCPLCRAAVRKSRSRPNVRRFFQHEWVKKCALAGHDIYAYKTGESRNHHAVVCETCQVTKCYFLERAISCAIC